MKIPPASIDPLQALQSNSPSVKKSDDTFDAVFSQMVSNNAPTNPLFTPPISSAPLALLNPSFNINQSSAINQVGSIKGLSPLGRNMALSDPESAYEMMTLINNCDALFKAQFYELSQMKSSVSHMQDAAQNLGSIALSTGNDSIKSQLQNFVGEYNSWIQRFNPDLKGGGLLAGTQAAQVSQFELEQNINSRFFGAKDGVNGLNDLGISIDPNTRLAVLDTSRLTSLLASNKQGVVGTVQEFSANFAKSASLLNSGGNFIARQIDNLSRVIHYVADNKTSLQAEFGTGDVAKPSGQVAQALSAYNQTIKT